MPFLSDLPVIDDEEEQRGLDLARLFGVPRPPPFVEAPPDLAAPEEIGADPLADLFASPTAPAYRARMRRLKPKPNPPDDHVSFDTRTKTWTGALADTPPLPHAPMPDPRMREVDVVTGKPWQDAPQAQTMGVAGVPLPAPPPSMQVDPAKIARQAKQNFKDLLAAGGPMVRNNPELGGALTEPPPTLDDLRKFNEATSKPVIPLSAGAQPGTLMHGVLAGAEGITTPENLALLAGMGVTGGAIAAAEANLRGYPLVALRGLSMGLHGVFTGQMIQEATHEGKAAYDAFLKGDMQAVAEHAGVGSVSALYAILGTKHGIDQLKGIWTTKVPKPSWMNDDNGPGGPGGPYQREPKPVTARQAELPGGSADDNGPGGPGGPGGPPAEPPKPSDVERVSPDTPNPPTAATPTTPEAQETQVIQLQQLTDGTRKVVMFPKGSTPPSYPVGVSVTHDAFGNIYVYRPDLIKASDIHTAAKNNTLPGILGSSQVGMGAPDKSAIPPGQPTHTVVARDGNGTEVQATATPAEDLPATIEATHHVTPPGGSVSVEPVGQVLGEREGAPPAEPTKPTELGAPADLERPAEDTTGLTQLGGDMGQGIVGGMREMLWQKVQAGDVTEGGQPSAVLQAAKMVRDSGGLQTPEELHNFLHDYGNIKRDGQFQQSMRDLVQKYAQEGQQHSARQQAFEERKQQGKTASQLYTRPDGIQIFSVEHAPGEHVTVAALPGYTKGGAGGWAGTQLKDELAARGLSNENVVGIGDFTPDSDHEDSQLYPQGTSVKDDFRRRGVASDIYHHTEVATGKKIKASGVQSPEGEALSKGRKSDYWKPKPARSYEQVQRDIDEMEDQMEREGVNVSRLYEPTDYNEKVFEGSSEWKPRPHALSKLYDEREAVQEQEDQGLDTGVDQRLKALVPDDAQRAALVKEITETGKPFAIRHTESGESIANLGRIANVIVKHVAENVTNEDADRWEQVKARLAGDAQNPSIQLVREAGPNGYFPFSEKTYQEAQKILDALMEGNAPKYPPRPLETYKSEEPEPKELEAPAEIGAQTQEVEKTEPELHKRIFEELSKPWRSIRRAEAYLEDLNQDHEDYYEERSRVEVAIEREQGHFNEILDQARNRVGHEVASEIEDKVKFQPVDLDDDFPRLDSTPAQFKTWRDFRKSVKVGDIVYADLGGARKPSGKITEILDWDRAVEVKVDRDSMPGHSPIGPILDQLHETDLFKGAHVTANWPWEILSTKAPTIIDIKADDDLGAPAQIEAPEEKPTPKPETPEAALVADQPKPTHLKPGQSLRAAIDEIAEEFQQHLDEGPDADRGERKRIVNRALDLRMKPKEQRTDYKDTTLPEEDLAYWESKLRPLFDELHKRVSESSVFRGKKITPETKASEMSPAEFATHRPEQAHHLPKFFTESLMGKPAEWTTDNLTELTKKKLDSLLTMHGLGTSGTKAQQVGRLIENRDLQAEYDGKTADDLTALSGKEIDALLDQVGVGKYGAKPIRAATFLNELAKRRAKGLAALARWNHQLAVERESGAEPSAEPEDMGLPENIETPREERRSAPRATTLEQPDLPTRSEEDAQLTKDINEDQLDRQDHRGKSWDEVEERFGELRDQAEAGAAEQARLNRIADDSTQPERTREMAREGAKAARGQLDKAFRELGDDYGEATYILRQRLGEQYGLEGRYTRPKLKAPITFFTGGAAHYEDVQKAGRERNDLGLVITPNTSHYADLHQHYPHVMVDNGVFSKKGFNEAAFRRLLDRIDSTPGLKKKIQFVVAPDVLVHDEETGDVRGDAEATLDQFEKWADELHARDLPVAFVAQPGIEHMLDEVPWDKVDTLFIGGHKPWKFGDEEVTGGPGSPGAKAWIQLFSEAHKRRIPIHVGRVYRAKDIEHVHANLGVRSIDSTHIAYEPSQALPFILRQLQRWNVDERETRLYDEGDMIRREEALEARDAAARDADQAKSEESDEDLAAPGEIESAPVSHQGTPDPTPNEEETAPVDSTSGAASEELAAPQDLEPQDSEGVRGLVEAVYDKLRRGESLGNVTELTRLAEQHFGSGRTSGAWSVKDMFDAMEAGINKYLVHVGKDLMELPFDEGIQVVRNLMGRITTQGTRTDEQIKAQQFSTPPSQAYLAVKVADVQPTDVVLEPSAGTGGLAALPKAIGATVHVNEISARRRDMLEAAGFGEATRHDGEIINSLLDRSVKPTVIIMNPPFSAGTVKSNQGRNRNLFGFNHVDSALQRLADGGRLVTILGGGQANEPNGGASLFGGQSGKWFEKLAKRYTVRANIRINGKEYQKYGTNFATRLIVIDKTGPTTDMSTVVQGNVDTLEQAYELLRPIAESRPELTAPARPGGAIGPRTKKPGTGLAGGQNGSAAGDSGAVQGERPVTPEGQPTRGPDQSDGVAGTDESGAGSQPPVVREPESQPAADTGNAPVKGVESRPENDDGLGPVSVASALNLEQTVSDQIAEEDTGAYVKYRPTLKGPAHPGNIVETKVMSTIPMPPITYKPSLPASVLNGGLSAVQLEAVAIAGMQNDIVLPGGARATALIGDGTGVGKGRISAGILYDNYLKGRKRLVWVSEKWDLMQDAMRDLSGIGANEIMRGIERNAHGKFIPKKNPGVIKQGKFKAPDDIKHEGLLFTTYSLIRSEDKKGNKRAAQLERYLRGDDDGEGAYILFDESHNLKNAVASGGEASQTGIAVRELLAAIPKLRTVSLSATAATDVVNLGYLDRLGLWGPGTAFPNGFEQFQNEVGTGGLAAMEMIATELKAQGKYVSRTLSFAGTSYDVEEHKLNPEQRELYRTAAKAWKMVILRAEDTIRNTTNGGARAKARFMSLLAAAQQRFFNVLITTLKLPTCIDLANKALADKQSVVITLVNTNEAAQNREKSKAQASSGDEEEDEPEDYDFGPREMLVNLVKDHYPVQQFVDDIGPDGKPFKRPETYIDPKTGKELPVINPQAEAERDALIEEIKRDLHLPENPLDSLINALGGKDEVAELTGRREYFDRAQNDFVPRGDPGTARKDVNLLEQKAFMDGKKRVAILSNAAGTGISLHASNQVKNQQRRYHITLQAGWSADKAMQMLGRTHRTDQASAPQYVMLISDLGGEKRFISTITKRMGSLGALTKGQKDAAGGNDLMSKVNFETREGEIATNSFYSAMLRGQTVPGVDMSGIEILDEMRVLKTDPKSGSVTVSAVDRVNVTRLLNRVLALDPDVQNPVYHYFFDMFEASVKDALDRGTLDTGTRELPGDRFHLAESREIAKDPQTGAKTFYHQVESQIRNERVSPKELDNRMERHAETHFLINDEGTLYLVRPAPPIVHADGTNDPASYVSTASNGRWTKFANNVLASRAKARPLEHHFQTQKEPHQAQIREAERNIEWMKRYGGHENRIAELNKQIEEAKPALEAIEKDAADPNWAKKRWAEQYEAAPTHTSTTHHMIGGAVMKYWNPIKEAAHIRNSIFSTTDTDTGQRVVGVRIPPGRINPLVDRISGGRSTVTPEQLHDDVLRNATPYTLEGNIRVRRGSVSRIPVIQFTGMTGDVARRLTELGAIYERGALPIYYLPTERAGGADSRAMVALTRIMQEFPVRTEDPPAQGNQNNDVYMGFGLGALQSVFDRGGLTPQLKKVSRFFSQVADDTKRVFAPQTRGPEARIAAGGVREMMGTLAQKEAQVHAALEQYRLLFRQLPEEHGVHGLDVIDAIESGPAAINALPAEIRPFATTVRDLYEDRKQMLDGLGLVKTFIENYFTHMYKNPAEAEAWTANWMAKRPLAGKESFRRQRVYPTLREALEDPDFTLVAKFDNPVDYVYAGLAQMDKSIAAHDLFNEWHDAGYLKYSLKRPDAGYTQIDDKLFTVRGPKRGAVKIDPIEPTIRPGEDPDEFEARHYAWEQKIEAVDDGFIKPGDVRVYGQRTMGHYWAPDQLAQVANNYLSPGLHGKAFYDAWMKVKNGMNAINLGFSAFHALTTTLNSSLSDMALGFEHLLAGNPGRSAVSFGRGFTPFASIVQDYLRGTRLGKVFDGTAANPTAQELAIVDALRQAGGRYKQSNDVAPLLEGLKQAWADNRKAGAIMRGVNPWLWAEQTMRPIMEKLVPAAKMGAFAKMIQFDLDRNPGMDINEAREKFGAALDSIDNRMGQLSQSNMLMHNTVRAWMNAIVGRPGWNLGTIREIVGGGGFDIAQNLYDLSHGKPTRLSHRSAYLLALLLGGAVMNGVLNFLLSGDAPAGMDFIAPRDGGLTESGHESRIVLPLYLSKDLYSWSTHPLRTLKAKMAQPVMVMGDLATNRDFYQRKIYGRGGVGLDSYLMHLFFPYVLSGTLQNIGRGESVGKTLLPLVGIMPASRDAGLSKAEKILDEYRQEQMANTRPAPTDHSQARAKMMKAAERGDVDAVRDLGMDGIEKGILSKRDVDAAMKRIDTPLIVSEVQAVSDMEVLMSAWEAATTKERDMIEDTIRAKIAKARLDPYKWTPKARKLAEKYFDVEIPTREGPGDQADDLGTPASLEGVA